MVFSSLWCVKCVQCHVLVVLVVGMMISSVSSISSSRSIRRRRIGEGSSLLEMLMNDDEGVDSEIDQIIRRRKIGEGSSFLEIPISMRLPSSSFSYDEGNGEVVDREIEREEKEIDQTMEREQKQEHSVRESLNDLFGSVKEGEEEGDTTSPSSTPSKRKIETYELMKTLLDEVQSTRDIVRKSVDMHALQMEEQKSLKSEMITKQNLKELESKITNHLEMYVNENIERAKNETMKILQTKLGDKRVRELQDEGDAANPIIMYETNTIPHGTVYVELEFLLQGNTLPSRRDFRKNRLCLDKNLGTTLSAVVPSITVSDVALDEITRNLLFLQLEKTDLRGDEEIEDDDDDDDDVLSSEKEKRENGGIRIRYRVQINERGYPDLLDYIVSLCCQDLLHVWQDHSRDDCNNMLADVANISVFGAPVVRKRIVSSVVPSDSTKLRLRGVVSDVKEEEEELEKVSRDDKKSEEEVEEDIKEVVEKSEEEEEVEKINEEEEKEVVEKIKEEEEEDISTTSSPTIPSPSPEPNCETGKRQSPIDIVNSNNVMTRFSFSSNSPNVEKVSSSTLPNLNINYPALRESFDIINTGRGVLMTYPSELNGTVTLTRHKQLENTYNDTTLSLYDREITYRLRQIHFHIPGEHRVDGLPVTDAELHMVHELLSHDIEDDVQPLLIIAIPISQSIRSSPLWQFVVNRLPILPPHVNDNDDKETRTARAKVSLTVNLNLGQIFFGSAMASISPSHYYTYHGSLTTEPCPEVVQWFVMKDSIGISSLELQALSVSIGHTNARETQNRKWKDTMKGLKVFTGA